MFRLIRCYLAAAVCCATAPVSAAIIHVEANGSGDYPTIQEAIDNAEAGDTVLLGPGAYYDVVSRTVNGSLAHSIAFLKDGVMLVGEQGPEATFLDGEGDHHGLVGEHLESSTIVRGVTFEDCAAAGSGNNDIWGGGLLLYWSSALIENCHFFHCEAIGGGGAFLFNDGTGAATVRSCFFAYNNATDIGGAVEAYLSSCLIENCTFVWNQAADDGGAILLNQALATLERNIFWRNTAGDGGGAIQCYAGGNSESGSCNLFWQNISSNTDVRACGFNVGSDDNVQIDPLFCDVFTGDYRLQADSPGAPANSGACGLIGAFPVGCGASGGTGVAIPELIAEAGTEVTVPILLQDQAVVTHTSFRMEVTFDPDVLTFLSIQTAGTLSDGALFAVNEVAPGTLLLANANAEPFGGPGILIEMVLAISPDAVDGTRTPLTFQSFSWDEGIPPSGITDGGITIGEGLTLGGQVAYYSSTTPVEGVAVTAEGDLNDATVTDVDGNYQFSQLFGGIACVLTPSFADQDITAVSSLDASLILQYLVELETLTSNQILAADLTGDGTASPQDASMILQLVVGGTIPDPLWLFVPELIEIASLDQSVDDADFAAILRGDVTGNWCPEPPCPTESRRSQPTWTTIGSWQGNTYELTLRVPDPAHAMDFTLSYESEALELEAVEPFGSGLWDSAEADGRVLVAGATALPWEEGAGVVFRFASRTSPRRASQIEIGALRIDESAPDGRVVHVPGLRAPLDAVPRFDFRLAPNPARADVACEIVGGGAPVRVRIVDVAGRQVRVQPARSGPGQKETLTWDRRDDLGATVANGIYFVRAESGDQVRVRRLVLMR